MAKEGVSIPTLYLTEQGTTLQKESETVLVTRDEKPLLRVPIARVERVMVLGNVQLTTQAIGLLLEHGVDVSFLTMTGKLKGRLVAAESKNIPLRLAQYGRAQDAGFVLPLARAVVRGKLQNQRALLQRFTRNHPNAAIEAVEERLARLIAEVDTKMAVAELMGLEGAGAAAYFRAFSQTLQPEFAFTERIRRPPKDPTNALLSFGYTLVGNELTAVVASLGLDPYIGFLHGISYGRPSLPLDLLEEFRAPVVDRLTAAIVNLNILEPDDFQMDAESGGVRLKPPALKRYLSEYEKALNTPFKHPVSGDNTSFRRLFLLQAHALARIIKDGGEYQPFGIR